jgi:hypothetical protein
MATIMDKIKSIEDEMARTQKNKATSGHLGGLKARRGTAHAAELRGGKAVAAVAETRRCADISSCRPSWPSCDESCLSRARPPARARARAST